MKKISIDELISMVDSSYSLVTIVSRRARQIIDGSEVLIDTNTIKPVAIAIEEFYEGSYRPIYDYDQYKKNLEEAEAVEAAILASEEETEEDTEQTDKIEEYENYEEFEVKEEVDETEENTVEQEEE